MIKKVLFSILMLSFGAYSFAQDSLMALDTTSIVTKKDSVVNAQPTPAAAPVAQPEVKKPAQPSQTVTSAPSSNFSSTLKGGLYLRAGLMFPSSSYTTGDANMGYDFRMGSQFYIGPVIANRVRLGLDVTWYDFAYAQLDRKEGYSLAISAFGVGPLVSFAIANNLAITTYAKAVPTFSTNFGYEDVKTTYAVSSTVPVAYSETKSEFVGRGGFCIAGIWGIDVRYSLLNIGFEINWGNPKVAEVGTSVASVLPEVTTEIANKLDSYKINNSRVYIGIRF
jgi:hypothetical protein